MKYLRIIVVVLCLIMSYPADIEAQTEKKVVLILINEISLSDLDFIPAIKDMVSKGSIGLMNTRTSTNANTYKAYTTIGSGTRAEATSDSYDFRKIDEEISEIYKRRTGFEVDREGLVNLNMAKLARQNENGEYGAIPGSLGQSLQNAGKKTAVLGNSDTDHLAIRLAPAITMDQSGYLNFGEIDHNILEENLSYPFGIRSNYSKMLELFTTYYEQTSLVVIDLGDIGRLERYKGNLSDSQYMVLKNKIFEDMNLFIDTILSNVDINNTRIFVTSPYPSSSDISQGRRLSPILVYGDMVNQGFISSDTTRREGIVGNIDIAPSILKYLEVDSVYMQGKPFSYISKEDNFELLISLQDQVVSTSKNRYPVLSSFAIFEILVSFLTLILLLFKEKFRPAVVKFFKITLLSTMIIPFKLLIIPIFKVNSLANTFILIGLFSLLYGIIIEKILKELDTITLISGLTTIAILTDIVLGGKLIKNSLLGYDPIIGARYYGIGNEYMGVLIGSTLVFATSLLDRFKISRKYSVFIFLITIVIIGLPKLGANVGGTIVAVSSFTFTILRLYRIKIRPKQILIIIIMVFGIVFIMAYIDLKLIKSQSHLAGAILNIVQGGPKVILKIITRKISMNLRLIGVTIWSKVLIATIIILGVLLYRPVKMLNRLVTCYPNMSIGWTGIIVACIVAFAVNDSGIVAAATGIIFLATSILYLSLSMEKD